ncbi:receptor-type tyrosine-protein phosphatase F-like [Montipora foliosa]|uniref:receptor-type tyrosine-protein phosphatase F-like n=1 Tax=Montipora foliosa TaxID=591990 RepID=UPI0035F10CAD
MPVPVKSPVLVNVTAQSSTSVAVFWELSKRYYNERNLISFKLLYQKEGSNQFEIQTIKDAAWVDTKNVSIINGSLVFSTVVTGLEKFTEYEFKVCVFSSVGCGRKSSLKIARTWEDVPSKAPSNFRVTANTSTAIIASWQLPSPDSRHGIILGFKMFFRKEGSNINRLENISVSNITMYTKIVTGLAKFTPYEFCVLAFTSAGDGINSSVRFARTKEDIPSNAPSGFMVTASNSTSIRASWELPPADSRNGIITGFKLFYRQKHSDNEPKLLNISHASIRAETVRELMKFTEYQFQLLAYTSVGDGPNSSVQFAKTMEDVPSKAPNGFIVNASTSSSVTASWQLPPADSRNGIITGFKLFIKRKGSDVQMIYVISNPSVYTKTVTGLQESTEYELQVLAYTSVGDGPKSFVHFVKTKEFDFSGPGFSMASILGFSVGGVSLLGFLLLVGFSCHKKRRKKRPAKWTAKDIKPLNSCEIPPERIESLEEVGQGAFGKVHKAKLIDGLEFFNKNTKDGCEKNFKYKIVAVKELHENATEEQKNEFLDEIETMKVVGKNPNVLNFVGCWTTATPLRLIVEYIPHGDLLQWLRAKRSKIRTSTVGATVVDEDEEMYNGARKQNSTTNELRYESASKRAF